MTTNNNNTTFTLDNTTVILATSHTGRSEAPSDKWVSSQTSGVRLSYRDYTVDINK